MSDENLGLDKGNEPVQPTDPAPTPIESPGKILAARRQELNWTVEDVAHALHLAPRQVHAIEADNFAALPGTAVTRGFIRSYAKLVKLDPSPLLEKIAQDAPDLKTENASLRRALPAKPFYAQRPLSLGGKPQSRIWIVVFVIVLLLLAALFFAWKADWLRGNWIAETKGLFQAQTETGNAAQPSSTLHSPLVEKVPAKAQNGKQISVLPDKVLPSSSDQPGPQAAAQGAALLESAPANGAVPEQKDVLLLKLREDSWIEIRNLSNKVLVSRLAKAGESETIPVSEPLKLTIGNAAGVDAQLRGVPVELNASARSNVARLTVN